MSVATRRYWLWVTRPAYYLNENKEETEYLEPDNELDDWWTCDQDTRKGDFVLLYRTHPKKDIRYLLQVTNDADVIDDPELLEEGWDYRCG